MCSGFRFGYINKNGAQVTEVEEPLLTSAMGLFRPEIVFHLELEAFAEPKALSPKNLQELVLKHGSCTEVGRLIDASEGFVRKNQKNRLIDLEFLASDGFTQDLQANLGFKGRVI